MVVPGMEKYKCAVCGYIYDPVLGEPNRGAKPMTPFAQLSDAWVCPICGVDKSYFQKVE